MDAALSLQRIEAKRVRQPGWLRVSSSPNGLTNSPIPAQGYCGGFCSGWNWRRREAASARSAATRARVTAVLSPPQTLPAPALVPHVLVWRMGAHRSAGAERALVTSVLAPPLPPEPVPALAPRVPLLRMDARPLHSACAMQLRADAPGLPTPHLVRMRSQQWRVGRPAAASRFLARAAVRHAVWDGVRGAARSDAVVYQ